MWLTGDELASLESFLKLERQEPYGKVIVDGQLQNFFDDIKLGSDNYVAGVLQKSGAVVAQLINGDGGYATAVDVVEHVVQVYLARLGIDE